MTWDPAKEWAGYVPPVSFEEYSKRYADFFKMRRQDGIIELRTHTDNGPYKHSHAAHNAWPECGRTLETIPKTTF